MKININEIIQTSAPAVPQVYCYSTPGITYHDGWVKIGYTERDVEARIREQTHTAHIRTQVEWHDHAVFDDNKEQSFTDKPFHAYLIKQGILNNIEEGEDNEWFKTTGIESKGHFDDFRKNHGILKNLGVVGYRLREEQDDAVDKALAYSKRVANGEFLWNAKPRFGKTLSVYDLCKRMDARKVLIVTNRPSIANSWYDDYEKFLGTESGYAFISETDSLKYKKLCISRETYVRDVATDLSRFIEFISLQDLKGGVDFGGKFDKYRDVAELEWDLLVIDEAHEGVDTFKTDIAFERIKRKFTLHLSGTPFKALATGKFNDGAVFNWTYADEQEKKANWKGEGENPYANLPKLSMLTYRMSDIIRARAEEGISINGNPFEYAFDLNEFFATTAQGAFVHDSDVDAFLNALTREVRFPFSTPELRKELKHTFWLLERVDSAKALAKKLKVHPIFKDYEVILAAGDGKVDGDEDASNKKSYDKVKAAIGKYEKTITLSVGQLTTGITIPDWTAVLMLSNMKSASLYMQAAFRAQNPCLFQDGEKFLRKENAYVFDFDPARTLLLYEKFANNLCPETACGGGTGETREGNIKTLLNYMPVYGEGENGEMVELDAARVLSIPREIHAQEVVRHGFMSNFLFENIAGLFRVSPEMRDIINRMNDASGQDSMVTMGEDMANDLGLDENGEVKVKQEYAIGEAAGLFGEKIYGEAKDLLGGVIKEEKKGDDVQEEIKEKTESLQKAFHDRVVTSLLEKVKEASGDEIKASVLKQAEREANTKIAIELARVQNDAKIEVNKIERDKKEALKKCETREEEKAVEKEAEEKVSKVMETFHETLEEKSKALVEVAGAKIFETVEVKRREDIRDEEEDKMRNHLRGFARTIPSFLMAYGNDSTTLETFEVSIPDEVFRDVTNINREEFVKLRDEAKVFNATVFNDSIKEFLKKKEDLANYFEEGQKENIFNYIPPQKTNQIFTPERVVKEMVDLYEKENPGCFDNPDLTFADLYVKSGLFLAEIVKRLYQSEKMKEKFPDCEDRLKHIFAHQIYGYAPTEIIYRIVESFLLGFDKSCKIITHNLKVGFIRDGMCSKKD